jgi:release factor glutamine methyltransferase
LQARASKIHALTRNCCYARCLHCRRIDLYVHFEQPLQPAELAKYHEYVIRRGKQEPLAYILGHKEFLHYDFKVAPGFWCLVRKRNCWWKMLLRLVGLKVLRNLSLRQVQRVHLRLRQWPEAAPVILDVGCGSGIIILSLLAMLPQATGTGLDISPAALEMAKTNSTYVAEQIKDETLPKRVTFVAGDATKGSAYRGQV